jgi:hypothetical protein
MMLSLWTARALAKITFWLLILFAFGLTILPVQKSVLLTSSNGWSVRAQDSSRVYLRDFPAQFRPIRKSAFDLHSGQIFRTLTADRGFVPLDITSRPKGIGHPASTHFTSI